MPGLIQANTACELSATSRDVLTTCEQIVHERIPNLFRPYLNPYVAQTCYCLTQLVESAWPATAAARQYQVFLANSLEEAASGAIKLARYAANAERRPPNGLILSGDARFQDFAFSELPGHERVTFIPGIEVQTGSSASATLPPDSSLGFIVVALSSLVAPDSNVLRQVQTIRAHQPAATLIVVADRASLLTVQPAAANPCGDLVPDIVVVDESFVDGGVPFGAFIAAKRLYGHWNRRGMATFHSTTYQPNTIASRHFMRCLERSAPQFFRRHEDALRGLETDLQQRHAVYRDLYSPSLAKLTDAVGFDQRNVRAAGHYIELPGRRLFDCVAGVACSIRGHNPATYVADIERTGNLDDCRDELQARLHAGTGLPHAVPAVSGASAVEHALRLALVAKHPKTHVLALRGGFGGKTLLALTGTWKQSLKAGLTPLYPHVVYVDPFGDDIHSALDEAFARFPIGVVQLELVQGVGGVREIPRPVLEHVSRLRQQHDCALLVDEVQTGMFRTGPFVRSREAGLQPDLLTIGKGTSDMMFPFAMTLYSDALHRALADRGCTLPRTLQARHGHELGYRTLLNVLQLAEAEELDKRTRACGELFALLLERELGSCPAVREVRCFGLLVGIELETTSLVRRRVERLLPRLYLLSMLNHRPFPVVAGYCQYDPRVLKLTPPLSITSDEIRRVCATISTVLRQPLRQLAASAAYHGIIRPRIARFRPSAQRSATL